MNTFSKEKIILRARKEFEAGMTDQKLLIELYRNYADVGDTSHFVTKAKDIFPDGNCGLATLYLQKELGGKIIQGKYREHDHTFLFLDETVIDITADQFGGPKIYIGPLHLPWALKGL